MRTSAEQHNLEIHENRMSWDRKPVLRAVYEDLYRAIASGVVTLEGKQSLELGSGMGNIKHFIPDCVTSDIFPNPWLDQTENAYELSFGDEELANIILFDVWHHLEHPANALREAGRVLCKGGRLIVMDPAMSLVSRFVYGLFHHEPLGASADFSPDPANLGDPDALPYFAAQASAHRLLLKREIPALLQSWRVVEIRQIVSFAYLASGGFRGRQLYPDTLLQTVKRFDVFLSRWPALFAARLLVVLEKLEK
jgi:SAM-dependent methyltransferase